MTPLRAHFLGTGTSTALPVGPCLAQVDKPSRDVGLFLDSYHAAPADERTPERWGGYNPAGEWPASVACGSCRAAVNLAVEEGWKNRRGNPAMVLRKQTPNGEWRNIVVDVGKTFREQSCRFFPRWGIKHIDAVLITHGHADAYNGLDDLREWCVRQGRPMPIYLTRATFETVAASFPYLVDKTKASGGGDLPTLQFHVIDDECEFEVEGIKVTTLPVVHGRYFHNPAPPNNQTLPPAPSAHGSPQRVESPAPPAPEPFICLGYVFDNSLVYLSDLSAVPERIYKRINETIAKSSSPPILVADTLWPWRPHASHISFPQAMDIALRLTPRPAKTYLVGMTHPVTHWTWQELCRHIRGQSGGQPEHYDHLLAQMLIAKVWESDDMVKIAAELAQWGGVVEPAWDGLGLEVTDEGFTELPLGEGSAGGWGF